MDTNSLLIKNGSLVNSSGVLKSDIFISGGKITQIGTSLDCEADRVIDAAGKYIFPGLIDPQVHFRDPGLTHKEDLKTGSMAAAAGGITTFFEMPNTNPSTITLEKLEKKYKVASEKCITNFSFFFGATNDNIEEIKKMDNTCGLKIFMGSSTGDLLVDDDEALDRIFSCCDKIIAVHAEDEEILKEAEKKVSKDSFANHPDARPVEAALKATTKAVNLALKYKKRLHVLHLSTAEEVEFLRKHKSSGLITAETTPQHLLMHAPNIYNEIGSFAQMNPPIREKYHQKELWAGLKDGTIDCVATDHAPHTFEEKALPYGEAPSGMPGVQTSLTLMLNEVANEKINLEDVVKWMAENPAKLYNIKGKGFLKEGYDADITIVDMDCEKTILNENMYSKCGWTAFHNTTTKGWPIITIVNGNIVYENDELNLDVFGKPVKFNL
jgi:dihydroorotase